MPLFSFFPSQTRVELRTLGLGRVQNVMVQSNVQRTSSANRHHSPSQSHANRANPTGGNATVGAVDPMEADRQEYTQTLDSPYEGKTAVVVGAGPCGSIMGLLLAMRGFNVKVFEKRPNPMEVPMSNHRSVPIVLNDEVSTFLMDLGLEVASEKNNLEGLLKFKYSSSMEKNGKIKPVNYQVKRGTRLFSERHAIAEGILRLGLSKGLPNLEYMFDCGCQGVDFDSKTALFSGPEGKTNRVHYDLLVGADGVSSQVRKALKESGQLDFTQRSSRRRYISFRDLPMPEELCDEVKAVLSPGLLVFGSWKPVWKGPEGFLFYRTQNGMIQGSVGGIGGVFEAIKGRELEWIARAAPETLPKEWLPLIVDQIIDGKQSIIGPVTYCSTFIAPDVALIGDAAHSATPNLGLGANRGILDARDLAEALGNSQGNITEALQNYDAKCRPQVAAIQAIELCHPRAALKGQSLFWTTFFDFYLEFHSIGNKRFPSLIPPSALAMMFACKIPPVECLKRFRRAASIFSGTAIAIIAAGLTWVLKTYPMSV